MASQEHKSVMIAFQICTDPDREHEFNNWYNHTHIPDLSGTEGLIGARRFVSARDDGDRKYLIMYEIAEEDPRPTFGRMREGLAAKKAHVIDFFKVTEGLNFKRIL